MADPKWIELAKADIGTREIRGRRHNRKIVEYFADVGQDWVKNDETAWCAAFVGSCLERAGIRSTRKLTAKSYLRWGVPTKHPRLGTIVVLNRGNPNSWTGHVGFYIRETDRYVYVLGGNQSDAVNIRAFPKWRVAGYRNPPLPAAHGTAVEVTSAIDDINNDPAFDVALEKVLLVEGGVSDHPNDPGGFTNKGITLATFASYKNVKITDDNVEEIKNQLVNISDDDVRRIYWKYYWIRVGCNLMPDGLSMFVFDTAVMHGPSVARKILQEALGVEVDGIIGPKTLSAAEEADAPTVLKRMHDIRMDRLRKSKNWGTFGEGWTNRIEAMFDESLRAAGYTIHTREGDMAPPTPPPPPSEIVEAPPGLDKFWLQSLTVWGAIITIAAVAIPEIGKLVGYDVTPEMIKDIGTHGAAIVQSVASLIGAIMVVYGRMRATKPIRFGLRKK
jgi:uncharacterized protein (TIGR02594 family)